MYQRFLQLEKLLGKKGMKRIAFLLPTITVTGFLEMAGMGTLLPFLKLVSDPSKVTTSSLLHRIYDYFQFDSTGHFVMFFGFLSLSLLLLSNSFNAWTTWRIMNFSWEQNHELSSRLFSDYLQQPYSYFLNKNSSDVSKNILTEVQQFTQTFLIPFMVVISKLILITAIVILLLIYNPTASICILSVILTCYLLIYTFFRTQLLKNGKIRVKSNHQRFRMVNEAMGGIKEVKILNLEDYYKGMFNSPSWSFSKTVARSQAIATIPRYLMETVAFGSIITITLFMLKSGENNKNILPFVGLYAFAGYRLMPALQQFYSNFTMLRNNIPTLSVLLKETQKFSLPSLQTTEKQITGEPISVPFSQSILFDNISYAYPNSSRLVLENVTIKIPHRATVGIVGETGSGKTTAVDIIMGLLTPTEGNVFVDNIVLAQNNIPSWQNQIGYVPQFIYLSDNSVAQNIGFGIPKKQINMEQIIAAAKMAHLHDFITQQLPQGYDTIIGERGVRLSGGQRQRIGIARALYRDPQLLIMDEATSSLDNETEEAVMEAINSISHMKTLIIIAHRLTTVKKCDFVLRIKDGKCITEMMANLPTSPDKHLK